MAQGYHCRYFQWPPVSIGAVTDDQIIELLAVYNDKPWRGHPFYQVLRTFLKWVSLTYETRAAAKLITIGGNGTRRAGERSGF